MRIWRELPARHWIAAAAALAAFVLLAFLLRACTRETRMILAVKHGDRPLVEAMLAAHPKLLAARDQRIGATPLHWAIASGDDPMAEFLLARGAEIDLPDHNGMTPLHTAAAYGRAKLARQLLERGAVQRPTGVWRGVSTSPLHLAADRGATDIARLLLAHGADANQRSGDANGVTPLHLAAGGGHLEVVQLLLDAGADADALDAKDKTPLRWAREFGHDDVIALLRAHSGTEIRNDK